MIDEVYADGLDRDVLRRLSRRSDARGFLQLGAHLSILAGAAFLVWMSRARGWVLVPALLLYGIALNFVFCALHETIHRTAFAARRVNDAVAWVAGALLLLPPEYFRAFHFAHHRFTQDPARDPELAQPPPATMSAYLWRASGIPNWQKRLSVTLRHALTGRVTEPFIAVSKRPSIVREARILWLVYAAVVALSLALRSTAALIYWIVPVLLGQPFLRLYLLSEHMHCAQGDDMFANTRTTYTLAVVRLLAWQMPFHAEHHAFPGVPFHRLSQVNALVRSRIREESSGYLRLHAALVRRLRQRRAIPQPGH